MTPENQVHLVVAVRDGIAHGVHNQPGNIVVLRCECRINALDVSDAFDVAEHGVLH